MSRDYYYFRTRGDVNIVNPHTSVARSGSLAQQVTFELSEGCDRSVLPAVSFN